jgi:threonyl-tRNA synthetase
MLIPIADRHHDYAHSVAERMKESGIRVQVDERSDRMNAKIRDAQMQKVPYMLIVGDREAEAEAVAVRLRSGDDLGAIPVADLMARMLKEIETHA